MITTAIDTASDFSKTASPSRLTGELTALRGATATVWAYSPSLQTLTLQLQMPGQQNSTHLIMSGCSRIEVPPHWLNSHLELSGAEHGRMVLVDPKVETKVECLFVHIQRNETSVS